MPQHVAKRAWARPALVVLGLAAAVLSAALAALPDPPVELNHLYVTLEKPTIEAIGASGVLARHFTAPDVRTVKTTGESWTGTYLMGWRGYLELFGPGGFGGATPGASGLGFSMRRPGTLAELKPKLAAVPGETFESEERVAQLDGESVPWFEGGAFRSLGDDSRLAAFIADFHREYLDRRGAKLAADGLLDRHEYVAARFRDRGDPRLLDAVVFDDIVEVDLEVTAAEAASLEKFVTAMGWKAAGPPARRNYHAKEVSLVVTSAAAPAYRVRRVVCSLRRPLAVRVEHVFGPDARLSLNGRRGTWEFGPR